MYKQKNAVSNLENVGFSIEGHEGLYNIFMMEEAQTIIGVGAGAVTKLVDYKRHGHGETKIVRIFNAKYPYEYLSKIQNNEMSRKSVIQQMLEFYSAEESNE